jgi:hypothetical protein
MMMRTLMALLFVFAFVSCSKKTTTGGGGTVNPPVPVTPIISLPQGWKYNASYSTGLPNGMQVFSYDTIFNGKSTKAFCLAYDSKLDRFEFKPVLSATAKKPMDFFTQEAGVTYACINGGFFGGNSSFSLVKHNNTVLSANIKSVNRNYNGSSTPYYPTRAAFGVSTTGSPSVAWIYHIGAGNDNVYSYPSPSPNAEGSAPQQVPDASFPAGGAAWSPVSAIGGSPMLIKDGAINISDVQELININNTASRPRSAIGYTSNGIVLLVAVEGDNTIAGYSGISLAEEATMMQGLGCTHAVNLDGGGSTSLVISNRLTVRPGDNGVERPVVSALLIKQK